MQDVYIVEAVRTPVGKAPKGVFHQTRPDDLLSHTLSALCERVPSVPQEKFADVIIGCAMPEAEQGMNVARTALLLAGFPDTVPGMTVNRFCASGLETIALAADRIRTGAADVIIAGGTESMSMVPMGGHKFSANPQFFSHDENYQIAYGMGITAEIVAEKWNVTREQQEAFALQSHQRAASAIESGWFDKEIAPFTVSSHTPDLTHQNVQVSTSLITHDEGPRPDTSLEKMATLRTVFAAKGCVTAATSSQMSDGAAAVMLASEQAVKDYKLTPLARFVSYAVAGVAPEVMGIGPVEAIPKALTAAGLKISDIDWIELNEAFAAQSLAVISQLKLDPEKVNPQGGAIALGHPLGATGSIRAATLTHGLKRTEQRYGMVTMCIGTGMGAAGIFERI